MEVTVLGIKDVNYTRKSDNRHVVGRQLAIMYSAIDNGWTGSQVKEEYFSDRNAALFGKIMQVNIGDVIDILYFAGADGKAVVSDIKF